MSRDPKRRRNPTPLSPTTGTRGPVPTRTTASLLLAPLSALYALGARWRVRRWRHRARRLPRPVLSVGNLTFGGTGKTPFVIHACRELRRRGRRVAILSRGYRARHPAGNDEALVIRRHLPDVAHLQHPDRYAAGLTVVDEVDVFVLDDGFQHLPLQRDADVVLIDATDPFGGGSCPPGGRLREPLAALARATLVILTRADLVGRASLGETMRTVRAATAAPIVTAAFAPSCDADLAGREVCVACGIGNPRAFARTVESLGARVGTTRFFRDHHAYTRRDAEALAHAGRPVVVTEKDAVKLEGIWPAGVPLHVVRIDFRVLDGGPDLDALMSRFS
ncbi:MAG: tetraacyldisaccharide 4'-kinase [Planctomycetota bacterium]